MFEKTIAHYDSVIYNKGEHQFFWRWWGQREVCGSGADFGTNFGDITALADGSTAMVLLAEVTKYFPFSSKTR